MPLNTPKGDPTLTVNVNPGQNRTIYANKGVNKVHDVRKKRLSHTGKTGFLVEKMRYFREFLDFSEIQGCKIHAFVFNQRVHR